MTDSSQSITDLIDPSDARYSLGYDDIDEIHHEFIHLLNRLAKADRAQFAELFNALVTHTEAHFSSEAALMQATNYTATAEHTADHDRVLGDLHRMLRKVNKGSTQFARAYVTQQLPDWFTLHTATMDSSLVAHIQKSNKY